MTKRNLIIGLVIFILVVAGGVYWMTRSSSNDTSTPSTNTSNSPSPSNDSQPAAETASTVITYSDSGYSPATVTVKSGDSITIKNTSAQDMQFDSDPHPIHTNDPELNVGAVAPGKSMTFTVTEKGTHGYHNHLNPSDKGTIVVE